MTHRLEKVQVRQPGPHANGSLVSGPLPQHLQLALLHRAPMIKPTLKSSGRGIDLLERGGPGWKSVMKFICLHREVDLVTFQPTTRNRTSGVGREAGRRDTTSVRNDGRTCNWCFIYDT